MSTSSSARKTSRKSGKKTVRKSGKSPARKKTSPIKPVPADEPAAAAEPAPIDASVRKPSRKRWPLIVLAVSLLLAACAGAAIYLLKPGPVLPASVQSQLDFTPYVIRPESPVKADRQSYKYDPSQKGLSFTAVSPQAGKLVISEQATPQQFIDLPDFYTKLVDHLNRYSVFDNRLGTVYLTRPHGQRQGQTAVIDSNGVLMFVRSTKDLSDDQWRRLFQAFELENT